MAVYSVLSMSSVATVLMAGNVQANSIPPERHLRDIHRHALCAPSLRPSADCGDQFELSASYRVLHCVAPVARSGVDQPRGKRESSDL